MLYFGCLLVNPHVQAVQNMCGKGGLWVFQAELGAAEVYPNFQKKESVFAVSKKTSTVVSFVIQMKKDSLQLPRRLRDIHPSKQVIQSFQFPLNSHDVNSKTFTLIPPSKLVNLQTVNRLPFLVTATTFQSLVLVHLFFKVIVPMFQGQVPSSSCAVA